MIDSGPPVFSSADGSRPQPDPQPDGGSDTGSLTTVAELEDGRGDRPARPSADPAYGTPSAVRVAVTRSDEDLAIELLEKTAGFLSGRAEPATLIRVRHEHEIRRCVARLAEALDSPPERIELVAEKLRDAAHSLGRLTGAIGVEDVLESIFREFCIGK